MKGFKVEEFNPMELRRDGSRLVLVVKNNQVERYVEEDDEYQDTSATVRATDGLDHRSIALAKTQR